MWLHCSCVLCCSIPVKRFRSCLDVTGFLLNEAEYGILFQTYILPKDPNSINYKAFVTAVINAFIPLGIERAPTADATYFQPYNFSSEGTLAYTLTQGDHQRIDELMSQIGYTTHTRRILYKPDFQHFDSTRTGCVSRRQFESIVGTLFQPIRFTARDLELLSIKYQKADIGVNYVAFCVDVGVAEREAAEVQRSRDASVIVAPPPPIAGDAPLNRTAARIQQQPNAQQLLSNIRYTLQQQRANVDNIFEDFDKLRKGRVTRAQFYRCLNIQGLKLSPADMKLLYDMFPYPDPETDDIDYMAFARACSNSKRIHIIIH